MAPRPDIELHFMGKNRFVYAASSVEEAAGLNFHVSTIDSDPELEILTLRLKDGTLPHSLTVDERVFE